MFGVEGGEVVGCIEGDSIHYVGFIYVLYVKVLYVKPEMKDSGIGSALLDFLADYQKEQYGVSSQEVNATTGNKMGIPFYENKGFRLIEVIPKWIDKSDRTENRYRRDI